MTQQVSVTSPACVFCDALAQIDEESLIVHRGRQAYAISNKFPYNNGHADGRAASPCGPSSNWMATSYPRSWP